MKIYFFLVLGSISAFACAQINPNKAAVIAAMMAGVESNIKLLSGDYDLLVNEAGAKVLQSNLEALGPIKYTDDEIEFANRIMKEYGHGIEANGLHGEIKSIRNNETRSGGWIN